MKPLQKLHQRQDSTNSLLCVGLDSDFDKLPEKFKKLKHPQFEFNKWIIEQTHEFVSAYKPNSAFYEARGDQGVRELKMTMEYLRKNHPDIFTICDAKRADIGSTNEGYVSSIFDWLGFDAVTVNPYLGREAIQPFLQRRDKVSIILARTSNPGAGELQDLQLTPSSQASLGVLPHKGGRKDLPLWQIIAHKVAHEWNEHDNCMIVMGATKPEELQIARSIVGDMDFLVPGVGAQGGEVEAVLKFGKNSQGKGLVINSARGVIFAKEPHAEAKRLSRSTGF